MLELQNICYRVSTPEGEQDILKNVSITIPDHKLVVFTGPNGGGKTTLAKVIMGLVQPTSGRVLYNGEDVTDLSITERAKRGISYGFQQPPRFKGITVHDLLLLAAGEDKLSKDKCCAYLTKVGLCANDYLDREVDVSLSGGEVKRIFEAKHIPIWVDLWGHDVNHDWNWWYKQTAYYMPYILGEQ